MEACDGDMSAIPAFSAVNELNGVSSPCSREKVIGGLTGGKEFGKSDSIEHEGLLPEGPRAARRDAYRLKRLAAEFARRQETLGEQFVCDRGCGARDLLRGIRRLSDARAGR